MFGDLNRAVVLGNVTRDPELRYTPGGTAVLSFSVATNRRYQKDGQWVEVPSYHNIVVWNNAEELSKRIKKGTRLYIEGRMETRSWESSDGKKNYKMEINVERLILIDRYEGGKVDSASSGDFVEKLSDEVSVDEVEINPEDLPF
ncbi:single-stranded DNA-binding protein [Candidatus Dojkabacteria bacterium]|uniref:Single-stranded DNA-binding protein n=1 Tax=Candidatus Dojkabacteria bacterium TaxID=2099670 RepID=A0A3M0Z081_9BACT|nr:MAG: single-stranded DNA-binding protein [Candidatus Dojkabacteria bacterium]